MRSSGNRLDEMKESVSTLGELDISIKINPCEYHFARDEDPSINL